MYIKSLELTNYRNYETLNISFDEGTNILYGDNAQGKTNILESIYLCATTKSHKRSKDKEMIRFGNEEAHIRLYLFKNDIDQTIDMHLRSNTTKGIAIDKMRIKTAAELMGLLKIVFFSPEDLSIIKNGPAERRHFIDMELCQIDSFYLYNLNQYNKTISQRNNLLKDLYFNPSLSDTMKIWNSQLVSYGSKIIERRINFIEQLNDIIHDIHKQLSGEREDLILQYEPNIDIEHYEEALNKSYEKDMKLKQTSVGPHRDDISFMVNGIDIRKYGSQGQQRTAALSLKLSEIELIRKLTKENPILLLDDVLSELDSNRQNYLLNYIGKMQTIITCTGLDDFINNRFEIDKVFKIDNGKLLSENQI